MMMFIQNDFKAVKEAWNGRRKICFDEQWTKSYILFIIKVLIYCSLV